MCDVLEPDTHQKTKWYGYTDLTCVARAGTPHGTMRTGMRCWGRRMHWAGTWPRPVAAGLCGLVAAGSDRAGARPFRQACADGTDR